MSAMEIIIKKRIKVSGYTPQYIHVTIRLGIVY